MPVPRSYADSERVDKEVDSEEKSVRVDDLSSESNTFSLKMPQGTHRTYLPNLDGHNPRHSISSGKHSISETSCVTNIVNESLNSYETLRPNPPVLHTPMINAQKAINQRSEDMNRKHDAGYSFIPWRKRYDTKPFQHNKPDISVHAADMYGNTEDVSRIADDLPSTRNGKSNIEYGLCSSFTRPIRDMFQNRHVLVTILLGQFLSICISVSGLCCELLTEHYNMNVSGLQTSLSYFLIFIAYTPFLLYILIQKYREEYKKPTTNVNSNVLEDNLCNEKVNVASQTDEQQRFSEPCQPQSIMDLFAHMGGPLSTFLKYIPLYFVGALVDYEANYMVVYSYEYINMLSVTIILCLTTPMIMALSMLIYRIKYRIWHYAGVFIALGGIALAISYPCHDRFISPNIHSAKGYLLCSGGAFLYCISNLLQEYLVKKFGITPFLAMLGIFGVPISLIQGFFIFRQGDIFVSFFSFDNLPSGVVWEVISYALSLFLFYSCAPIFMYKSNTTLFNLSLLTSTLYSFIMWLAVFRREAKLSYIGAFILVIFGVFTFNVVPVQSSKEKDELREKDVDLQI
jgi:drug/metabolite transporter (DMT)-like permease